MDAVSGRDLGNLFVARIGSPHGGVGDRGDAMAHGMEYVQLVCNDHWHDWWMCELCCGHVPSSKVGNHVGPEADGCSLSPMERDQEDHQMS